MKIKELEAGLFGLYPRELAAEYDNVGLIVGDGDAEITGIVVALDCTEGAVELAKSVGANLIVTHHPVIFSPIKSVTDGDIVFELIKSGIACIAMHTNFDSAEGGVCDTLAEKIGLEKIVPLLTEEGIVIRQGEFPSPLSACDFAKVIKNELGGNVKFADTGKLIKTVALCSGSGSSFIYDAINCGADAYVSSEIKHHLFYESLQNNMSIFDCGHFESEVIAIDTLKNAVESVFGGKALKYIHSEIKTV